MLSKLAIFVVCLVVCRFEGVWKIAHSINWIFWGTFGKAFCHFHLCKLPVFVECLVAGCLDDVWVISHFKC